MHLPATEVPLIQAIRDNIAVAVSDASLKHNFGTAAFTIEGANALHRALGAIIVPGPVKDGDSYRCELAGLLAIVIWVNALCKLHNLTQGSVLIACDNISTL